MIQYYFCLVCLLFFFLIFVIEITKDIVRDKYGINKIIFCGILAILYKFNWGIEFFGLEYEDAYVFSFCARQFSHGIYSSTFLIDAISIGSLDDPIAFGTYGGHFITYPTFLSIFTRLLWWSPQIISIINVAIAFLLMLILSLMGTKSKYWMIAPLIYCAAPIINVFATCFLAEIFSSFICISFIYSFFRGSSKSNYLLRYMAFFVAILCKRENLVLLIVPLIDLIFIVGDRILKNKKQILLQIIPYMCITLIYFILIQNVLEIEKIEAKDIGCSTFSLGYFVKLFPVFLKSLLSLKTFGISVIVSLIIIVLQFSKLQTERKGIIMCLSLAMLYLVLYSSHYRGYFFIHNNEISEFETFRYINNFFYLIPVAAILHIRPPYKKSIIGICSVIAGLTLYFTISARLYYSNIENESRFCETHEVLDHIEKNTTSSSPMLICDNILIYQNICQDNFAICDTRCISWLNLNDNNYTYYCISPNIKYLKERYNISIDMSRFKPIKTLINGETLYVYQ